MTTQRSAHRAGHGQHEQQTHAARAQRITPAMRRGELVAPDSPHKLPAARHQFDGTPAPVQHYTRPELRTWLRPGADDHERHPSKHGGLRKWRDGRVEAAQ